MTKQFIITTLIGLCIGITAGAQTFTQRLQKTAKGEATVTVHHDEAIDKLVNGPQIVTQATSQKSSEKKATTVVATTPATTKQQDTNRPKTVDAQSSATAQHNAGDTHIADTTSTAQKSGHSYKTTGYRIQVYAGGNSRKDRQQAEQIGNQLRMLFPLEAVYVHFYSPRWICRMGNYRTYEEAHQSLQEVKKLGYSAATIVKGKITLQY